MRFILQKAVAPGYWVCTDTENHIVCVFAEKNFNGDQNITQLEDFDPANFMHLARLLREMGEWLQNNYPEKL